LQGGCHRVSLQRIASHAGVAVRTIYTTFGGKAGLFEAVLCTGQDRLSSLETLLDPALGMEDVLTSYALQYVRFLGALPFARLHLAFAEWADDQGDERTAQVTGTNAVHAQLLQYFSRDSVRQRLFAELPLALLPRHFLACVAADALWPSVALPRPVSETVLRAEVPVKVNLFLRSVIDHAI